MPSAWSGCRLGLFRCSPIHREPSASFIPFLELVQLCSISQPLRLQVGCNTKAVRDMLGGQDINEANMLSYLGIIEQRTNELLQAYSMNKAQKPIADPLDDSMRAPALCSLVSECCCLMTAYGGYTAGQQELPGGHGSLRTALCWLMNSECFT